MDGSGHDAGAPAARGGGAAAGRGPWSSDRACSDGPRTSAVGPGSPCADPRRVSPAGRRVMACCEFRRGVNAAASRRTCERHAPAEDESGPGGLGGFGGPGGPGATRAAPPSSVREGPRVPSAAGPPAGRGAPIARVAARAKAPRLAVATPGGAAPAAEPRSRSAAREGPARLALWCSRARKGRPSCSTPAGCGTATGTAAGGNVVA
mmetsp:Transcript_49152/g.137661  ORF Transcript_49152/g.137661 Transcript_49152/m.137661 type:complete len:207 (+) Transcript_49152:1319-1939(+)